MFLLKYAFKSVQRQPSRTAIALASIAVSVAVVMASLSFASGLTQLIFGQVLADSGHLEVTHAEYARRARFRPLRYFIPDAAQLAEQLRQLPAVQSVARQIQFGASLESGKKNKAAKLTGVDLDKFPTLSSVPSALIRGDTLHASDTSVLLGRQLADELGVNVGDTVTALGYDIYESFSAVDLRVAGIFDRGSEKANRAAYVSLQTAQQFLDMKDGASQILVYTGDYRGAARAKASIAGSLQSSTPLAVRSWQDNAFLASLHGLLTRVGWACGLLVCLVAGMGIFNMFAVTVVERRREVGVLRALGMGRQRVLGCFLGESAVLGALGSSAGLLLGIPVVLYLKLHGVALPVDRVKSLPVTLTTSVLYGEFNPTHLLIGAAIGVALTIIGMTVPMLRAYSVSPLVAMRR